MRRWLNETLAGSAVRSVLYVVAFFAVVWVFTKGIGLLNWKTDPNIYRDYHERYGVKRQS